MVVFSDRKSPCPNCVATIFAGNVKATPGFRMAHVGSGVLRSGHLVLCHLDDR